jgi:hypothetical protein
MSSAPSPMSLAEAVECCGQLHLTAGGALEQCGTNFTDACENCPLLIERRSENPDVMIAARAM